MIGLLKGRILWVIVTLLALATLAAMACGGDDPETIVIEKEVIVEVEKQVVVEKEVVVEVEKEVVVEKEVLVEVEKEVVVEREVIVEVQTAPADLLKGQTIKIGISEPLTGGSAFVGIGGQNAMNLRRDQVNDAGGILGAKIEYLYLDHESRPSLGAIHAERFCSDSDIIATIGFANSEVTLAGQGALADCGLALVVEVSTNPNITLENPGTTFRVSGRDDRQGPMGAIYAAETQGWTRTVVTDDQSAFGRAAADAFEDTFKGLGGEVLKREAIRRGDKDVRAAIRAMPDIDFVYYCGLGPDGATWVQQMRELGRDEPVLGCDGLYSVEDYITASGGAALEGGGSYNCAGTGPSGIKAALAFEAAYIDEYGPIPILAQLYYDAAFVLLQAIERAAIKTGAIPTRAEVVESLKATSGITSVGFGTPVSFNDAGDNTGALYSCFSTAGDPDRFVFIETLTAGEVEAAMRAAGVEPK